MYKNFLYTNINNLITIVGQFQDYEIKDNSLTLYRGFITKELINVDNSREVCIALYCEEGRKEYQGIKLEKLITSVNIIPDKLIVKELKFDITNIEENVFNETTEEFYSAFSSKEIISEYRGITEAPGIF